MRLRRLLLPLMLVLACAGASAPGAQAGDVQLSVMMDDDLLLYRGDDTRDTTMRRMKDLGVDYVRVSVLWSVVAEHARFDAKGRRRKGFRADRPGTYPRGVWDKYDRLVRAGRTLGVGVFFNVTGPGPRWAMGRPPASQARHADTWQPDVAQFGKFVRAVARRYDGTYVDENDGRQVLPRVSFWSIYNEPNQPGWLTPQWRGSTPWSPVQFRNLWIAGRKALNATGHQDDVVVLGETAPLGSRNRNAPSPIAPKRFIRELFCVDAKLRPYRGAAARRRDCERAERLGELRFTAWAHHPYTKDLPPTERDDDREAVTIANIGELPALLDRIAAVRPGLPEANFVALTEFGYETDPPDPFSGVPPALQAAWLNTGDWIAYQEPRVIANTQFLLKDGSPVRGYRKSDKRRWFTYQSGLFKADGRPKPAAIAYRFPFVVTKRTSTSTSMWGWIRFLPFGTRTEVLLQFRPSGASTWHTIDAPVPITDPYGSFEATRPIGSAGTWRAVFVEKISGTTIVSREVPVS